MDKFVRVHPEPKMLPNYENIKSVKFHLIKGKLVYLGEIVDRIDSLYKGFISKREITELILLASKVSCPILEIGSFKGKSTVALAIGSNLGNKVIVNAIDPHSRTLTHMIWNEADTLWDLIGNLTKFKVEELILIIPETSKEAIKNWNEEIELLFIDGSHKYKNIVFDIVEWSKFLISGGTIILHDFARTDYSTRTHPSVTRAGSKYILLSPDFTDYRIVDGMLIAKKV